MLCENAAAKAGNLSFAGAGLIIYSGITLAILDRESRSDLFDALSAARANGAKIAFDPNYRPALWENEAEAKRTIARAYELCDIALSGVDDECALFAAAPDEIPLRLQRAGVAEIVVKAGAAGAFGMVDGEAWSIPATTNPRVVYTTAAGDAFNGAYLARRVLGYAARDAAAAAVKTAAAVISFSGAIAPIESFNKQQKERGTP